MVALLALRVVFKVAVFSLIVFVDLPRAISHSPTGGHDAGQRLEIRQRLLLDVVGQVTEVLIHNFILPNLVGQVFRFLDGYIQQLGIVQKLRYFRSPTSQAAAT